MARTIEEINNAIIQEKEIDQVLNEIDTSSKFTPWGAVVYLVAKLIHVLEVFFDIHKKEVETQIQQNVFGSAEWFVLKAYEFQYGDDLTRLEGGGMGYEVIDLEKRMVTQAAITQAKETSTATLKVAKTIDGKFTQLSDIELAALRGYIDRLQPPGAVIVVNSLPPDALKISLDVYYNPLLNSNEVLDNVEAVILAYLAALPFDGKILKSKLADVVLQSVSGVSDVVITLLEAKEAGGVYQAVEREYISKAGYVEMDATHSLGDNINLIIQ